jgi:hypothetical protein
MAMRSRSEKKPDEGDGSKQEQGGAERQLGGVDPIAHARTLAPITRAQCPVVPGTFQVPEDRRGQLRTLDGELFAETVLALKSVAKVSPEQRAADLGEVANDALHCGDIAKELVESDDVVKALREALAYAELRRAIVASDAVVVMETIHEEAAHRGKRAPAVAKRYEAVAEVLATRNAKVAAGIEAAKAAKRNKPA